MKFSIPKAQDKLANIAGILGVNINGLSNEEAAGKSVGALKTFMESIDLPTTISALGIKEKDIGKLAQNAYEYSKHNFEASPRVMTLDDAKRIYKASL